MGVRLLDVDLLRQLFRTSGGDDFEEKALLKRYSECQTEALGGQILKCSACGTRVVHYNPCNVRGCPKCAPYHQGHWRQKMQRRILRIGHHHLVYSGPRWLYRLWLIDATAVMNALFAAASTAVRTVIGGEGRSHAATMVFHSHGAKTVGY